MPNLELARKLIAEQFPEYSNLPITDVEKQGHDNRTYRLGDHMLIRMPTAGEYALKVPKEQELLPQLDKPLRVSIPAPIKMGKSSGDYPYPFSIYKWLPGKSINLLALTEQDKEQIAFGLTKFLKELQALLIIAPVQVEQSLKAIYDHLKQDGIFLFEGETLKEFPERGIWRGWVLPKPKGQKIILSQRATMRGDICTSLCRYELMEEAKIIHAKIEELRVKIYEQDPLLGMVKSAGFKDIRTIKAFDQSLQPANQDESMVYECRK